MTLVLRHDVDVTCRNWLFPHRCSIVLRGMSPWIRPGWWLCSRRGLVPLRASLLSLHIVTLSIELPLLPCAFSSVLFTIRTNVYLGDIYELSLSKWCYWAASPFLILVPSKFSLSETINYLDLGCYFSILAIALSNVRGHANEERRASKARQSMLLTPRKRTESEKSSTCIHGVGDSSL